MSSEAERDRFARLIFYAFVILAGYLAFRVIRPFLQPLGWAAVFALMLQPVQAWLRRRLKPGRAALATTLLATIIIVGPAVWLLSIVVGELSQLSAYVQQSGFIANTPDRLERLWLTLRGRVPLALPEDPAVLLTEGVQRVGAFVAARAGTVLQNVAGFLFSLLVMIFALFFFLRDGATIMTTVRDLLPFEPPRRDRLLSQINNLVVASVGASLTVAAAQGLIGGVTFGLLGFGTPTVWGVVMAFCSLLPVVGSAIIWLPAAVWLLLSQDVTRGVILIAVGVGVIGMVDNIIRPLFLTGRTSASGLVIFLGLMGGVAAFGFIGLVAGPIILVTALTLVEAVASSRDQVS